MYSCPGCGSQMLFDIPGQSLKCGRCDRTMSVEEADRKEARTAGSSFTADLLTCPTCGAAIQSVNAAVASFCSYCGSSVLLEKEEATVDPPESVTPFQITQDQCFEKYRSLLKKSFCVDHRLKKNVTRDSFRGIYVPFHTYKAEISGECILQGQKTKGDTTYYYDTKVQLDHHFEQIVHDASREFPDHLSERIAVFAPEKAKPFSPAYLSGFYADEADTNPETYIPYAKSEALRKGMDEAMADLKAEDLNYSVANTKNRLYKSTRAFYTGDTLIPVWFMSMRSGKRLYYAVQNGVTGEMWADMPMDVPRFGLLAGGLAVALFLLFQLLIRLTLRPEMVMIGAMLLALFAQIIVNVRRRRVWIREHTGPDHAFDMEVHLADIRRRKRTQGLQKMGIALPILLAAGVMLAICIVFAFLSSVDNINAFKFLAFSLASAHLVVFLVGLRRRSRMPAGCYAALAASVLGAFLLVSNVFHSADMPIWMSAFVMIAAVIWEGLELLLLYNKECSSPLPQFVTHQGGEQNG